jgi:hypothetical protein
MPAIVARFAIDVASIIHLNVKRDKRSVQLLRTALKEAVEELLPGAGMYLGGTRQDAIHVEENSIPILWR